MALSTARRRQIIIHLMTVAHLVLLTPTQISPAQTCSVTYGCRILSRVLIVQLLRLKNHQCFQQIEHGLTKFESTTITHTFVVA
mmetsp:Transcript_33776/g.42591  ORF Transcript_33776/g.42591 Transcript_33776/m.42591 type:complete len:84 (+) Transcript_33776:1064-1315(+)